MSKTTMAAFDALPQTLRERLRYTALDFNAGRILGMLRDGVSVATIERQIEGEEEHVRRRADRRYGERRGRRADKRQGERTDKRANGMLGLRTSCPGLARPSILSRAATDSRADSAGAGSAARTVTGN